MAIARRLLVPEGISRCYHCVSRCVRRAFLCDNGSAHRKEWIKSRLMELGRIFAIEIGGFAIMGNHLHLLVRTQPTLVAAWSDEQVARRWMALYPKLSQRVKKATGAKSDRAVVDALLSDPSRVRSWRQRLASLSWFMKCLKEPVARRANRDDHVTGHFWEGRFKVQSLLDEAAVLACMVYIDLNPIRAEIAQTPEESNHTSIQDRIRVRQWRSKVQGLRARAPRRAAGLVTLPVGRAWAHDEDGIWMIPIERRRAQTRGVREGLVGMKLDEYLELVDLTGREVRPGKRQGDPRAGLNPILSRLELDAEQWVTAMLGQGRRMGTAIGSAASLAAEAVRRGTRWVVSAFPVYREIPAH